MALTKETAASIVEKFWKHEGADCTFDRANQSVDGSLQGKQKRQGE